MELNTGPRNLHFHWGLNNVCEFNCIKTGEEHNWIPCTEYGKLGANVRSSQCLSAGGSYVYQGDRTRVKKRACLQGIHCNLCVSSLASQTGSEQPCALAWLWLRQVGVTVKSKYLIFLQGGPSESLFLWSQTLFFPEQRYHRLWQKGCCSPDRGSANRDKHSRLGWSLTQMDGAGGRWHLLFHCLERSFSGLTLHSLTLVLCNSITLVRLPPGLCQCQRTEYQRLSLLLNKVWCYSISGHHHVLVVQQIRIMLGKSLVLQFNLC